MQNEDESVSVYVQPKKASTELLMKRKGSNSGSPEDVNIPIEKLRKKVCRLSNIIML